MNQNKIHGLILSAGLSGRMGKFKPLLHYKGKSFIQNIVFKLNSVWLAYAIGHIFLSRPCIKRVKR
ncbi:MAG: NTP transferase domain-containing protein [Bacteroidota bacterium]